MNVDAAPSFLMDLSEKKSIIRTIADRLAPIAPPGTPSQDELDQAEEIVGGQIRFNGLQPPEIPRTLLTVGRRGIDWSGSHLNHQEWPTQLNRFLFLLPLLKAYEQTRDVRFADVARGMIDDWMEHFDEEDITHRGNTCMDIGIRLGTQSRGGWGHALAMFMDCPSWDDAFIERMLASMERQAVILWRRGIPSRGGNHRIFGLDGLLHVALRLPFMEDAEAMRRDAVEGLNQAFAQQFLPDGAHFERTLQYHRHMVGTFLYLSRLGQVFSEVGLVLSSDRLLASLDYIVHNLGLGINDHSAERVDQDHGAVWATVRQWRSQLTGRDESGWTPPPDAVFGSAGQVFARSSWEPGGEVLAFDTAGYGGGHAHLARLGVVFRSDGRLWLADPGMFDYEMSNPFATYGRSTPAHSTLNLNGWNQGIGDARLLQAKVDRDIVFARGLYGDGYWPGTYTWSFSDGFGSGRHGRHERMVLWIRGEYLLVFDAMACDDGETIENVWQMAPVGQWEHDPEQLAFRAGEGSSGFYLRMVLPPEEVEMRVLEGQRDPLRGWYCETYSQKFVPAPQIVFRSPGTCNAFAAVLAMPVSGDRAPPVIRQETGSWGRRLEIEWADGRVDVVGIAPSLASPLGADSPFKTDSPLVWLRLSPEGKRLRQFALDGTFVRYREER